MKTTIVLVAIALGTATPCLAQENRPGILDKQSATTSSTDTQDRGTGNGKGTRKSSSMPRAQAELL
ncbi:MAG: hypothetical protein ACWA47_04880 [Brevirhabdus sp.]